MYWEAYTIWAVICGLAVTALVLVPAVGARLTTRTKVLCVVAGLGFAAYGVFVAAQTTGTWGFPLTLYLLPVLVVAVVVREARNSGKE